MMSLLNVFLAIALTSIRKYTGTNYLVLSFIQMIAKWWYMKRKMWLLKILSKERRKWGISVMKVVNTDECQAMILEEHQVDKIVTLWKQQYLIWIWILTEYIHRSFPLISKRVTCAYARVKITEVLL